MDEKCCVPFFPFCVQQSMQGSFQLLSPLFDYIQASKEGKTTGKKAEETLLNFVMRLSHRGKRCHWCLKDIGLEKICYCTHMVLVLFQLTFSKTMQSASWQLSHNLPMKNICEFETLLCQVRVMKKL